MRPFLLQNFTTSLVLIAFGCSGASEPGNQGTGAASSGGSAASSGGSVGSGGTTSVSGGTSSSGGSPTTGGSTSNAGTGTGNGGTTSAPCTNVRPTGTEWDEATCDQWASETNECNQPWMVDNDYCNQSCGRCMPGGTGGTGGAGGSSSSGGEGGTNPTECAGTPLSGGNQHCSNNQGTLGNGVSWSVWLSNSTSGTNCGTFYGVDAAFKASWNMPSDGDFLARAGLQWNKTQTHEQLGTISADFAYTKTNVTDTKGYIGVYGWSSGPLVEFYIVEEWMGWNPASNAEKKGTFEVDGGTYDVYTHTQVNQPSIEGNQTFPQYFSIRQTARQCGHISISEHFKQWGTLGLNLGKMYEAKLLVEAMSGSGTIDFTTGKVSAQ